MALLAEADLFAVWAEYMRELSGIGAPKQVSAFTKLELRAAVDAADKWAEDSSVPFSAAADTIQWVRDNAHPLAAAFPAAFAERATTEQQERLLARVVERRFVRGV